MNLSRLFRSHKKDAGFATASWQESRVEKKVLDSRGFVNEINSVDEIWTYLKSKHSEILAIKAPHSSPPIELTYGELDHQINIAAKAFYSLGLREGDVVAFFSENSPRWLIADQGIMRIGGINAVRGIAAPINELKYIIKDSNSVALIVQSEKILSELGLTEAEIDQFKFILQLEGDKSEGTLTWDDLFGMGLSLKNKILSNNLNAKNKSMIATILYTSGTTGEPKGVPLTHGNLLHQIKSLACIANPAPGTPLLSVLPIWHAYERSAEYYFFSCGCTQNYTTIKHLKNDIKIVKPLVMATVPRLWEAIKSGFDDALVKMPRNKQKFIEIALNNSTSFKYALRKTRNILLKEVFLIERISALLELILRWPMHLLASKFIWPKITSQLSGGNLKFPINGGGAIAPHVDAFFEALGIELLVGYGLTETSPVLSCRRPWRNIRGSSGLPLPETQFKIIDNETKMTAKVRQRGRVFVKGPQVMSAYLGKPEETSNVINKEGWFDTGDIGMLLSDGSIVLTGRAKDTIVLSSGENIEPGPLEAQIVSSDLIDQVLIVGQDQRQLAALLVPNEEQLNNWLISKGIPSSFDLNDSSVINLLKKEVNRLLEVRIGSRREERVLGVAIVGPFSLENGLLTQTLKQKRNLISSKNQKAINQIYLR